MYKGPVTRYNFPGELKRNSTLKKCKSVTNVRYVKNILANCDGNVYLPILHLPRVEQRCNLQQKLHRLTGSLALHVVLNHTFELLINTTMLF